MKISLRDHEYHTPPQSPLNVLHLLRTFYPVSSCLRATILRGSVLVPNIAIIEMLMSFSMQGLRQHSAFKCQLEFTLGITSNHGNPCNWKMLYI